MKIITIILAVATLIISARGQSFLNLDFESAYGLPGNPGNGESVSVTNALPGWTAYNGPVRSGDALSSIYYVSNILGYASNVELEGGTLALSGNNLTVELFNDAAIGQTGLVPDNAESLEFEAWLPGAAGFSVTLGGQNLSVSAISDGPDYTVYEANIPSDLNGLSESLIFSCQGVGSGEVLLDDIEFSTTIVPEPSECALLGLGTVLFGLSRRRKP